MTRRDFLESAALALPVAGLSAAPVGSPETLPGTSSLTWEGDLAERMMDGAHRFVERKIAESVTTRQRLWHRDLSSRSAYEQSVEANRAHLRTILGVVDAREPSSLEIISEAGDDALVAQTPAYRVHQVRWPIFGEVCGEGLWLEPLRPAVACVVVLPDADQTPEQLAGLAPGMAPGAQFARRLAANGFSVLIPTLVDRTARWSGHPDIRLTDQPHREWIYRQAFHVGRHLIGYEIQKVLAAVDWFAAQQPASKIGVAGFCEGGLIAFYSAAIDSRIDAALVSGYFDDRQRVWSEPIYRNVFSLLREFGDAEIASLIAPRGLTVEYSRVPDLTSPRGDLRTPAFESVSREFDRIATLTRPGFQPLRLIHGESGAPVGPGSQTAVESFSAQLGGPATLPMPAELPVDSRHAFSADARQHRQVLAMEHHVQSLIRSSEKVRDQFFLYKVMPELAADDWNTDLRRATLPAARFVEGAKPFRRYFHEEILGRFDEPFLPMNPRTRLVYDRPRWRGYEVVLDVYPDVFAWGVLLVPKDLRPGERRPVVVCQHGRQGVPLDTIEGDVGAYRNFAAHLADQGFVVFSPHNLYRGEDRYRWLCRKANNVKATLFSFILAQHEQHLRWLASLPFVDPARIGFYGLSYGGETAVRVPAILEGYCLSICSGDFNSWTEKVSATDLRFGYMYTIEWEMPYFNMGSTFDYAEMAYLILPRPFMAERGHNDRVSRDQWVAYQYAKVRWLYAQLGLADRTEIEYFNGGHTINGEGTFRFLHRHLNWPAA